MKTLMCCGCGKEIEETDLNENDEWGYPLYYWSDDDPKTVICKDCCDELEK